MLTPLKSRIVGLLNSITSINLPKMRKQRPPPKPGKIRLTLDRDEKLAAMNRAPVVRARNSSNAMENSVDPVSNPAADLAPRHEPFVVAGIRLAHGATGVKYRNRDDLCVIEIADSSNVHCLFTKNKFSAAPITVARRHLRAGATRYLIINAGNANAGTGTKGERSAFGMCEAVSQSAGCTPQAVLPFSTGVIGEQLNIGPIENLVPELLSSLSAGNCAAAITAAFAGNAIACASARPAASDTAACNGTAAIFVSYVAIATES